MLLPSNILCILATVQILATYVLVSTPKPDIVAIATFYKSCTMMKVHAC